MKFTGSKIKKSRALGIPLSPKAERYLDRKPYPPGQHGKLQQMRRRKMSPYKTQLLEKQKLRAQYNIHERQLRNYYAKASRKGDMVNSLVQELESRLDTVVLRGGLARSIYAARQYVSHGHILVDGRKVNIASYRVRPNQVVGIREKSRNLDCIQIALDTSQTVPPYLERDKKSMTVKFLYDPPRAEVPLLCEVPLVIEFYSR
ncbi:MAG: 30S ribosomal protein S4 [Candidatus Latescibacteria bacterium]|nr:30S ribosomal protein S4 [Candidatus Latescibacterota bacterium]